jgi:anti-sigma factor RsiW
MSCDEMQILIHGYIDGELDAPTNQQVEAHLQTCEHCRRELATFKAVGAAIRRPGLYATPGAELETAVRHAAQAASTPTRVFQINRVFAVAAAIIIGALIYLGIARSRRAPSHEEIVASEVASSFGRSIRSGQVIEVGSSDPSLLAGGLSRQLNFAPRVPSPPNGDFSLVGDRLDYVNRRPVAVVVYRRGEGVVDLFMWPTREPTTLPSKPQTKDGYQVAYWRANGMDYWAVTDSAANLSLFTHDIATLT